MNFYGLDIETASKEPDREEYALQPWRVRSGQAGITHCGICGIGMPAAATFGQLQSAMDDIVTVDKGAVFATYNGTFDIAFLYAAGFPVRQYRWADAMLLWKWAANSQTKQFRPAWSLADAVRELFPGGAQWVADFLAMKAEMQEDDAYWRRRVLADAYATYRVAEHCYRLMTPQQRRSAAIEGLCLVPVAVSWVNGVNMDVSRAQDMSQGITSEMWQIEADLGVCDDSMDGWKPSKVLSSPRQLCGLLYDRWGLAVNEALLTPKGARSSSKAALTYLAEQDDRVLSIMRWRTLNTQLSKFINSPVKAREYLGSDTMHPTPKLFSTYCVPGDVEVLTPTGWEALRDWHGGEIAQVIGESCEIVFRPATKFVGPMVGEWVAVKHPKLDCLFTHGHTVAYYSQLGDWRAKPALEAFSESQVSIPLAGIWGRPSSYTASQTRFICAVHADGYLGPQGTIKFTFKKRRKVERIRALLTDLKLPFREYVCSAYPGRTEITVRRKDFPLWLPADCKQLGCWVLKLDRSAFLDELVHWDGSPHCDGGIKFCSAKEPDIDWVLTLAALDGRKAGRHRAYKGKHGTMIYSCHISTKRPVAHIGHKHTSTQKTLQRAYCAETETGFWLARSNGKIFVTGNTGRLTYASKSHKKYPIGMALHQWPRNKELRKLILPPAGYDLVEYDAAGQEMRLMAELSQDAALLRVFNNPPPLDDAHSLTGSRFAGIPFEKFIELKEAGNQQVVGPKGYRYAAKFYNLSCQYRISTKTLRIKAKVDYGMDMTYIETETRHNLYHRGFPGIKQYWRRAIRVAKQQGFAQTLAGRRYYLTDWHGEGGFSTEQSAINFPIQGSGGDMKELAIATLTCEFPQLIFGFDLHDALFMYIRADLPDKDEILRAALDRLNALPYEKAWGWSPSIPILWDGQVGPSWGEMRAIK